MAKSVDRRPPIMPGTVIDWHGRRATVGQVGWVGERYYWLMLEDGSIAMMPATDVEADDDGDRG